jgi:hypothetical protein
VATAAIYGKYPWHAAFMTMLCFMAVMVTGLDGRRWVLLFIFLPQVVFGATGVTMRLASPVWRSDTLLQVIKADAGGNFDPSSQLVAYPDLSGIAMSATENITMINGNNGELLGPINWRNRDQQALAPSLTTMPTPYWVICGSNCGELETHLTEHGRQVTLIGKKSNVDNGTFRAFRIDGPR